VTPAAIKPVVGREALDALDIRVGTIVLVEDVPKASRLVRLTVDFGDHRRRILAGMKQERANPREIEGRQSLFVLNLEPKAMMGELSEGVPDIGHADGLTPVLAVPERAVPDGARAGSPKDPTEVDPGTSSTRHRRSRPRKPEDERCPDRSPASAPRCRVMSMRSS
jgi:methionine--tRNA ligase beta chain